MCGVMHPRGQQLSSPRRNINRITKTSPCHSELGKGKKNATGTGPVTGKKVSAVVSPRKVNDAEAYISNDPLVKKTKPTKKHTRSKSRERRREIPDHMKNGGCTSEESDAISSSTIGRSEEVSSVDCREEQGDRASAVGYQHIQGCQDQDMTSSENVCQFCKECCPSVPELEFHYMKHFTKGDNFWAFISLLRSVNAARKSRLNQAIDKTVRRKSVQLEVFDDQQDDDNQEDDSGSEYIEVSRKVEKVNKSVVRTRKYKQNVKWKSSSDVKKSEKKDRCVEPFSGTSTEEEAYPDVHSSWKDKTKILDNEKLIRKKTSVSAVENSSQQESKKLQTSRYRSPLSPTKTDNEGEQLEKEHAIRESRSLWRKNTQVPENKDLTSSNNSSIMESTHKINEKEHITSRRKCRYLSRNDTQVYEDEEISSSDSYALDGTQIKENKQLVSSRKSTSLLRKDTSNTQVVDRERLTSDSDSLPPADTPIFEKKQLRSRRKSQPLSIKDMKIYENKELPSSDSYVSDGSQILENEQVKSSRKSPCLVRTDCQDMDKRELSNSNNSSAVEDTHVLENKDLNSRRSRSLSRKNCHVREELASSNSSAIDETKIPENEQFITVRKSPSLRKVLTKEGLTNSNSSLSLEATHITEEKELACRRKSPCLLRKNKDPEELASSYSFPLDGTQLSEKGQITNAGKLDAVNIETQQIASRKKSPSMKKDQPEEEHFENEDKESCHSLFKGNAQVTTRKKVTSTQKNTSVTQKNTHTSETELISSKKTTSCQSGLKINIKHLENESLLSKGNNPSSKVSFPAYKKEQIITRSKEVNTCFVELNKNTDCDNSNMAGTSMPKSQCGPRFKHVHFSESTLSKHLKMCPHLDESLDSGDGSDAVIEIDLDGIPTSPDDASSGFDDINGTDNSRQLSSAIDPDLSETDCNISIQLEALHHANSFCLSPNRSLLLNTRDKERCSVEETNNGSPVSDISYSNTSCREQPLGEKSPTNIETEQHSINAEILTTKKQQWHLKPVSVSLRRCTKNDFDRLAQIYNLSIDTSLLNRQLSGCLLHEKQIKPKHESPLKNNVVLKGPVQPAKKPLYECVQTSEGSEVKIKIMRKPCETKAVQIMDLGEPKLENAKTKSFVTEVNVGPVTNATHATVPSTGIEVNASNDVGLNGFKSYDEIDSISSPACNQMITQSACLTQDKASDDNVTSDTEILTATKVISDQNQVFSRQSSNEWHGSPFHSDSSDYFSQDYQSGKSYRGSKFGQCNNFGNPEEDALASETLSMLNNEESSWLSNDQSETQPVVNLLNPAISGHNQILNYNSQTNAEFLDNAFSDVSLESHISKKVAEDGFIIECDDHSSVADACPPQQTDSNGVENIDEFDTSTDLTNVFNSVSVAAEKGGEALNVSKAHGEIVGKKSQLSYKDTTGELKVGQSGDSVEDVKDLRKNDGAESNTEVTVDTDGSKECLAETITDTVSFQEELTAERLNDDIELFQNKDLELSCYRDAQSVFSLLVKDGFDVADGVIDDSNDCLDEESSDSADAAHDYSMTRADLSHSVLSLSSPVKSDATMKNTSNHSLLESPGEHVPTVSETMISDNPYTDRKVTISIPNEILQCTSSVKVVIPRKDICDTPSVDVVSSKVTTPAQQISTGMSSPKELTGFDKTVDVQHFGVLPNQMDSTSDSKSSYQTQTAAHMRSTKVLIPAQQSSTGMSSPKELTCFEETVDGQNFGVLPNQMDATGDAKSNLSTQTDDQIGSSKFTTYDSSSELLSKKSSEPVVQGDNGWCKNGYKHSLNQYEKHCNSKKQLTESEQSAIIEAVSGSANKTVNVSDVDKTENVNDNENKTVHNTDKNEKRKKSKLVKKKEKKMLKKIVNNPDLLTDFEKALIPNTNDKKRKLGKCKHKDEKKNEKKMKEMEKEANEGHMRENPVDHKSSADSNNNTDSVSRTVWKKKKLASPVKRDPFTHSKMAKKIYEERERKKNLPPDDGLPDFSEMVQASLDMLSESKKNVIDIPSAGTQNELIDSNDLNKANSTVQKTLVDTSLTSQMSFTEQKNTNLGELKKGLEILGITKQSPLKLKDLSAPFSFKTLGGKRPLSSSTSYDSPLMKIPRFESTSSWASPSWCSMSAPQSFNSMLNKESRAQSKDLTFMDGFISPDKQRPSNSHVNGLPMFSKSPLVNRMMSEQNGQKDLMGKHKGFLTNGLSKFSLFSPPPQNALFTSVGSPFRTYSPQGSQGLTATHSSPPHDENQQLNQRRIVILSDRNTAKLSPEKTSTDPCDKDSPDSPVEVQQPASDGCSENWMEPSTESCLYQTPPTQTGKEPLANKHILDTQTTLSFLGEKCLKRNIETSYISNEALKNHVIDNVNKQPPQRNKQFTETPNCSNESLKNSFKGQKCLTAAHNEPIQNFVTDEKSDIANADLSKAQSGLITSIEAFHDKVTTNTSFFMSGFQLSSESSDRMSGKCDKSSYYDNCKKVIDILNEADQDHENDDGEEDDNSGSSFDYKDVNIDDVCVVENNIGMDKDGVAKDEDGIAKDKDDVASGKDAAARDKEGLAKDKDGVAIEDGENNKVKDKDGVAMDKYGVAKDKDGVAKDKDGVANDKDSVANEDCENNKHKDKDGVANEEDHSAQDFFKAASIIDGYCNGTVPLLSSMESYDASLTENNSEHSDILDDVLSHSDQHLWSLVTSSASFEGLDKELDESNENEKTEMEIQSSCDGKAERTMCESRQSEKDNDLLEITFNAAEKKTEDDFAAETKTGSENDTKLHDSTKADLVLNKTTINEVTESILNEIIEEPDYSEECKEDKEKLDFTDDDTEEDRDLNKGQLLGDRSCQKLEDSEAEVEALESKITKEDSDVESEVELEVNVPEEDILELYASDSEFLEDIDEDSPSSARSAESRPQSTMTIRDNNHEEDELDGRQTAVQTVLQTAANWQPKGEEKRESYSSVEMDLDPEPPSSPTEPPPEFQGYPQEPMLATRDSLLPVTVDSTASLFFKASVQEGLPTGVPAGVQAGVQTGVPFPGRVWVPPGYCHNYFNNRHCRTKPCKYSHGPLKTEDLLAELPRIREFCKKGEIDKVMERLGSHQVLQTNIDPYDIMRLYEICLVHQRLDHAVRVMNLIVGRELISPKVINDFVLCWEVSQPKEVEQLWNVFLVTRNANIHPQPRVLATMLRVFTELEAWTEVWEVLLYMLEIGDNLNLHPWILYALDAVVQLPVCVHQAAAWLKESDVYVIKKLDAQLLCNVSSVLRQHDYTELADRIEDVIARPGSYGNPATTQTGFMRVREEVQGPGPRGINEAMIGAQVVIGQLGVGRHTPVPQRFDDDAHFKEHKDDVEERRNIIQSIKNFSIIKSWNYLADLFVECSSRTCPVDADYVQHFIRMLATDLSIVNNMFTDFLDNIFAISNERLKEHIPVRVDLKALSYMGNDLVHKCHKRNLVSQAHGLLATLQTKGLLKLNPTNAPEHKGIAALALSVCLQLKDAMLALKILKGVNMVQLDSQVRSEILRMMNPMLRLLVNTNILDSCTNVLEMVFRLCFRDNLVLYSEEFNLTEACSLVVLGCLKLHKLDLAIQIVNLFIQYNPPFTIYSTVKRSFLTALGNLPQSTQHSMLCEQIFNDLTQCGIYPSFHISEKELWLNIFHTPFEVFTLVREYLQALYHALCTKVQENRCLMKQDAQFSIKISHHPIIEHEPQLPFMQETLNNNPLGILQEVLRSLQPPLSIIPSRTTVSSVCVDPLSVENYLTEFDKKGLRQGLKFHASLTSGGSGRKLETRGRKWPGY